MFQFMFGQNNIVEACYQIGLVYLHLIVICLLVQEIGSLHTQAMHWGYAATVVQVVWFLCI